MPELRTPGRREVRVACDSLVALGAATADGAVLFAKNSDRPAAEPQPLLQLAAARHAAGAALRCTYIEIPQVAATARCIGSHPYWLWGFEHGLNEHGVAIGNHTVFTRDELGPPGLIGQGLIGQGLIGMDLVRLGLERAASATQAVEVMTGLIEAYGQGGSGYADKDWPYHNSFLVADRRQAWRLEASDRRWAARRVRELDSASNHLGIGDDWDALADGTIEHAVAQGWWPEDGPGRFDFAAAYRDTSMAPPVISSGRHRRTCELLAAGRGRLTPAALRTALRDHYGAATPGVELPFDDEQRFGICMHADPVGTTTASMIAQLPADTDTAPRYWASLGSPCLGIFLPIFIAGELPAALALGGVEPTPDSPWWRFKTLLTLVEGDWPRHAAPVRATWDALEARLDAEAATVAGHETEFMGDALARVQATLEQLIAALR